MRRSLAPGIPLAIALVAAATATAPWIPQGRAQSQQPKAQVIATWSSPGEAAERYRFSLRNFRSASSFRGEDYRQVTWPVDGVELVPIVAAEASRGCHREAHRAVSSLAHELNLNLRLRFSVADRPSRAAMVLHYSEERLPSFEVVAPRFRGRQIRSMEDHRTSCEQSALLYSEEPPENVHGYLWWKSSCVCAGVRPGDGYASLLAEARRGVARFLIIAAGLDPSQLPDRSLSRDASGKSLLAFYAYLEHIGAIENGLPDRTFKDRINESFGEKRN